MGKEGRRKEVGKKKLKNILKIGRVELENTRREKKRTRSNDGQTMRLELVSVSC